jgi:hypothetical protein
MSAFFEGFTDELMKLSEFVTGDGKNPTFKPSNMPTPKSTVKQKAVKELKAVKQPTKAALTGMAGSSQNAKQVRQYLPQDVKKP